ncbi:hypothetical protein [Facklamia sp. 7083-14-GEN3]|uniref:hypothetical protein n=1 Tax=Facklamia sp. 7083-14-GEN3 TaxID=2973478 RepID=UPI00215BD959|nr:hypothetical protein [Facklamia sp. 7083-14-GEN3]MCR8969740.1 hypothetical protein [Facklamia sp. 7083-14-GEN3]
MSKFKVLSTSKCLSIIGGGDYWRDAAVVGTGLMGNLICGPVCSGLAGIGGGWVYDKLTGN